MFNKVSRERLVGESSSPFFFCLDLGVKKVGKQLCFCGTNGKPTLLLLGLLIPGDWADNMANESYFLS